MPRLYNPGADGSPETSRQVLEQGKPAVLAVKVPPLFSGGKELYVEHTPGAVYLPLSGHTFRRVDKDSWIDLPPDVPVKAVKDLAPQLLTEEEYEARHNNKSAAKAASK